MNNQLINFLFEHSDNASKVKDLVITSFINNNPYNQDKIEQQLIKLLTNKLDDVLLTIEDFDIDKIKEYIQNNNDFVFKEIKNIVVDNILNNLYYTVIYHPYKYIKDGDDKNTKDYKYYKDETYKNKVISEDDTLESNGYIDYNYNSKFLIKHKVL